MSDEELRHLSPDQVVVRYRRLEGELAAAQARVAELEAALGQRGGPPKTPTNSSVPPSKAWKGERPAAGGKRGPPRGHLGVSRSRQAPDQVLACYPTQCAGCGGALSAAAAVRIGTSQVVDLPPVRPVVVEAHRYATRCLTCGTTTRAAYPAGLEPPRVFGPGLEAWLVYLHEQQHVSYQRLQQLCQDWWTLSVSEGAIANALRRVAAQLAPQAAAIREQVRASPVIGSDETSARVAGQTWWQWVFQTPTASYHVIAERRNTAVVTAFQAGTPTGTWVSDLWQPQLKAAAARHQVCLSHQLRDLQYVVDREQSPWAAAFQGLLRAAIHLAQRRDAAAVSLAAYAEGVAMVEAWCSALLQHPVPGAEASRLWVRFREHRDHLLVFLYDPAVPPTNNASEQALRPSVVHRKVTNGFRSAWGAEAHAAYATVRDTARKQGLGLLATLQAVLGPPVPTWPPSPLLQSGE